jgi:hypothetical protein
VRTKLNKFQQEKEKIETFRNFIIEITKDKVVFGGDKISKRKIRKLLLDYLEKELLGDK